MLYLKLNLAKELILDVYIFWDTKFSQFISFVLFEYSFEAILLLQFRIGEEILKYIFCGVGISNFEFYNSFFELAAPDFDVVKGDFFYFFMFLKDLTSLDRRPGIRELNDRLNTINESK